MRKSIKITPHKVSAHDHDNLLGIVFRDAKSIIILFPGDSFNNHTTALSAVASAAGAAATTDAWLHSKCVEFLARPAADKVDEDGAFAALFCG